MFKNLKIGARLGLGFGFVLLLLVVISTLAYTKLASLNDEIGDMVNDKFPKTVVADSIIEQVNIVARALRNSVLTKQPEVAAKELERVATARTVINEAVAKLEKTITSDAGKKVLSKVVDARKIYSADQAHFLELQKAGKKDEATDLLFGALRKSQTDYLGAVNELIDFQSGLMEKAGKNAEEVSSQAERLILILAISAIILGTGLAFWLIRSITRPTGKVVDAANKMSAGDFNFKLDVDSKDEVGQLAKAVEGVQASVQRMVADAGMLSEAAVAGKFEIRADATRHQGEFRRIIQGTNDTLDVVVDKMEWYRSIIDAVPFPIHVIDMDMKWTYLNKAFEKLMVERGYVRDRQDAVGRPCSTANANICNSKNCGIMQLKSGVKESFFDWGNLKCKQDTANVINAKGTTVGYVETVTDLSATLSVKSYTEREVQRVALNLERLSCGDLNLDLSMQDADQYTKEVHTQFGKINTSFKQVGTSLNALVTDAELLSTAAVEGKLATRADAAKHQGDFQKVVKGVNETLDAVIGPLNVAASYVDQISKGAIPAKITDTYNGDFNVLKNNLNTCIDAVNALVADANMLSLAAVAGKLETRADAAKHQGDFQKIVKGVNDTLDAVVGPIQDVQRVMAAMEQGDMTQTITKPYQGDFALLKDAINNTIAKLVETITQINTAADALTNAASQVSATAQSLSQSSSEQAASVEETTSSMEQMTASISQNTENAKVTDGMASKSAKEAAEGGEAVNKTVEDMKSIAGKIGIIDDIAYQTNLLALNAAIEAARAGDHGKGFAVVAAEVRKLAERSQIAAQEIGNLASSSVKQAERAGMLLTEMVPSIRKTSDLVQEIASASSEQSSGVAQINGAMGQLNQTTQQNASASEELAATAEELGAQANELQQTMTFFRLDRKGLR